VNRLVDSGDVDRWALQPAWDPFETYNRFLQSFRQGEWRVQRGNRVLVYGGVDFSRTPKRKVSAREFRRSHARVADRVRSSQRRAALQGGEAWLGGGSGRQASRIVRRSQRVAQLPRPPRQPEPCVATAGARARAAC
jgi:hypothetical protein